MLKSGARGGRTFALQQALANFHFDVQVNASKMKFAKLAVELTQHLGWRFAGSNYRFEEEKRIEYPIALGNVAFDANSAGFFGADENVVLKH